MITRLDSSTIEERFGIPRHFSRHIARVANGNFEIMHSQYCLELGDLMECPFTLALNNPILDDWDETPHVVQLVGSLLTKA